MNHHIWYPLIYNQNDRTFDIHQPMINISRCLINEAVTNVMCGRLKRNAI